MSSVEVGGSIKDLLNFYREEHRIYGKCPKCDNVFRLSEIKLTYGKEPPKDKLTALKNRRDALEEEVKDLNQQIEDLGYDHKDDLDQQREFYRGRLQLNDEKWRERQDTEVDKRLQKKIKEVRREAIAQSRSTTLGKAIERIAPMFTGFRHHPGDVRPLFEPIDFVVFHGLYAKEVTDLVFVEFKTGGSTLNSVQRSIREAVARKRIHFEELRMPAEVMKRMLDGKRAYSKVPAIEMKEPPKNLTGDKP
jgi:Predicted secreted endonuclease distantly related to archaeal Holliday junction resolvase